MTTSHRIHQPPTAGDGPAPAPEPRSGTHDLDVVVVGAGLAGLTAAAAARRHGASVLILAGRGGAGRATTDAREGFLLNRGPHAVYRGGVGARVLHGLDVELTGARPPSPALVAGPEGDLVPATARGLFRARLLTARDAAGLARFAAGLARLRPAEVAGLTTEEWLASSLPPRAARLVGLAARVATYTAALDRQSADVAATQLRAAARGVLYLHGGWAQLTDALRAAADGAAWSCDRVERVEPGDGVVDVVGRDGRWRARQVVLAVGSPSATAALLPGSLPPLPHPREAVEATCLDLGLVRPPAAPAVFGLDDPLYGVAHAPAARLAPPGGSVVHLLRYLRHGEDVSGAGSEEGLHELARRMGVVEADVVVERHLHRMTVVTALPTPASGGLAGRPGIDAAGAPGVLLAGDWVGPDGFLADASLASGRAAGDAAAERAADLQRATS